MWLFVPSACVQDTQDLNLGSDSQECPPLPPVTWRGKLMRQRTWSRLWKKVPWARLLSGLILPPSTLSHGLKSFIASLRDSPASHSPQLGNESTQKTSDGSGPTLTGFFASYDAESSSWRMSQGSLFQGWDPFSEPWPAWGSMRNGESFERPMPGLLTDGRVSSSSGSTPTVDDPFSGDSWRTPDALAQKRVNGGEIMSGPKKGEYIKDRPTLAALAPMWPTPAATDWKGSSQPGQRRGQLSEAAEQKWPTPTVGDSRASGGRNETAKKTGNTNPGTSLNDAMRSHQDQETETAGSDGDVKAVLSPAFVEALMGLRTGWSACASSETESSPSKQPSPSDASGGD